MKKVLLALIGFYKKAISPYTPPSCRFTPRCSEYARQAIITHGAFKGFFMSVYRVLRCNPFNKGGYDPVPPKKD